MYGNRIANFGLGVLVAASTLLSWPSDVAAYDVCADDYAGHGVANCAHEQMFAAKAREFDGARLVGGQSI